MADVFVIVYL